MVKACEGPILSWISKGRTNEKALAGRNSFGFMSLFFVHLITKRCIVITQKRVVPGRLGLNMLQKCSHAVVNYSLTK